MSRTIKGRAATKAWVEDLIPTLTDYEIVGVNVYEVIPNDKNSQIQPGKALYVVEIGHEKRLEARIVNYADDLVICCRGRAEEALARMRNIMTKLKLTANEMKTRVCKLPGEKFDFHLRTPTRD